MFLKNIYIFYFVISLPLALLALGAKYQYVSNWNFFLLLMAYCFIYHPFICGVRLIAGDKITMEKFWKNFIPFWNGRYWSFLFLNK